MSAQRSKQASALFETYLHELAELPARNMSIFSAVAVEPELVKILKKLPDDVDHGQLRAVYDARLRARNLTTEIAACPVEHFAALHEALRNGGRRGRGESTALTAFDLACLLGPPDVERSQPCIIHPDCLAHPELGLACKKDGSASAFAVFRAGARVLLHCDKYRNLPGMLKAAARFAPLAGPSEVSILSRAITLPRARLELSTGQSLLRFWGVALVLMFSKDAAAIDALQTLERVLDEEGGARLRLLRAARDAT